MTADHPRAGPGVYAGLLLTTMATLAYQLLLTRIFSVTLLYHFTFMAISVTMFGLTVGAIAVYLRPRWFPVPHTARSMAVAASCFAALIVISYVVHVRIPFQPDFDIDESVEPLATMVLNFVLLALPFICSGICVTLALTRFPGQIGRLYAADLIGAGLGCLAVAIVSRWIDAPSLIAGFAVLAAVAAACCLMEARSRQLGTLEVTVAVVLTATVLLNLLPMDYKQQLLRPRWVKGKKEGRPLFERWNAFSRVTVWPAGDRPIGWGMSRRFQYKGNVGLDERGSQLWLTIDGSAGTVLTRFDGDLSKLDFLRFDVTNVVHAIRSDARVLVVGSGGGRDVLSALYFRQPEIVGVEVNDAVVEAVHDYYGSFTGRLDLQPGVSIVNDEARSYLARTDREFDVIQVSLIDTWAATAAGAFVLTENGLYTVEALQRMFRQLSDRGVLSFSRWYGRNRVGEIYRLTALAVATLNSQGAVNPRDHLMIVHSRPKSQKQMATGMATVLVGREPFSGRDVDAIEALAEEMDFDVLLSPRGGSDEDLVSLASGTGFEEFIRSFPADISPPTDDRPYFFDMLRLHDVLTFRQPKDKALESNMDAIVILGTLLVTVVVLTLLCVIVPLVFTGDRTALAGSFPLFVYFCSIGLGFMLVEIPLIQRLGLFSGHPIYGMTVVLFGLLVAGGCGSWLSGLLVSDPLRGRRAPLCLAVLVGTVLLVGLCCPSLLSRWDGLSTSARIAVAVAILVPMGTAMGTAFPLGMRVAAGRSPALTPWLFGLNGATSICGSVVALVIALCHGVTIALLVGVACYLGAWGALLWARRFRSA